MDKGLIYTLSQSLGRQFAVDCHCQVAEIPASHVTPQYFVTHQEFSTVVVIPSLYSD